MKKIKETDAVILMEFRDAVKHLRHRAADQKMQSEMLEIGGPFLDRLKRNGHEFPEAIALMREAFDHQPQDRSHPTPPNGVYAY